MADKFIWYELITADQDAAIDFYTNVIGWTAADHRDSEMGDLRYVILSAGGRGVAGVAPLTDEMRPGWLGYIGVADTDSAAGEVEADGGRILAGPGDIPNVGRFAHVADPGGAPFYLMTPLPRESEPAPSDPQTPGLVSWHELYSSLGDRGAFDFYSARFGWQTMHEMDMGPMGTYRIFGVDGVQLGAMMNKPDAVPASRWGFYINVEAIDAAAERVTAGGGQVRMGPIEVPGGSWIIQCVDPQGVDFALVAPKR